MHSWLVTHTAHMLPTYPVHTMDTLLTHSQHYPDIILTRALWTLLSRYNPNTLDSLQIVSLHYLEFVRLILRRRGEL
jgi:hypothetical protein